MRLYVITSETSDFGPGVIVVREHRAVGGLLVAALRPLAVVATLPEARAAIAEVAPLYVRLDRAPGDDRVIIESFGSPEDVAACELVASAGQVIHRP